jgi:hypothetical protein
MILEQTGTKKRGRTNKKPAYNKRFGARRGGVCPQKVLSDFQAFAPARTLVFPALRQAAETLGASGGQHSVEKTLALLKARPVKRLEQELMN